MTPSEYWKQLNEEAFEAAAKKRRESLEKANAARKAQAAIKASEHSAATRHLHPADDPWSKTCRTLCGIIEDAAYVLAPRAISMATPVWALVGCQDCAAVWAAWRHFGNGKPLTYRRLNSWPHKDGDATMEAGEEAPLTPRARALLRAMAVREQEIGPSKTRDHRAGLSEDLQLLALQELFVSERGRIDGVDSPKRAQAEKAWSVEFMKMKPSKEVLIALLRT